MQTYSELTFGFLLGIFIRFIVTIQNITIFINFLCNEFNENVLYTVKLENSYHLGYLGYFSLYIFNNYVRVCYSSIKVSKNPL